MNFCGINTNGSLRFYYQAVVMREMELWRDKVTIYSSAALVMLTIANCRSNFEFGIGYSRRYGFFVQVFACQINLGV